VETRSPAPGHFVLASLPDGRIMILNVDPGAEALALYAADPKGRLDFLAGRRITWDIMGYDYSSNGHGVSVRDVQEAIESADAHRRNQFKEELDAAEARRKAEEERVRLLNEEEARRLREREGK
jgi:hypothetical protein